MCVWAHVNDRSDFSHRLFAARQTPERRLSVNARVVFFWGPNLNGDTNIKLNERGQNDDVVSGQTSW